MEEFTSIRIRLPVEMHEFLRKISFEQKKTMTSIVVGLIKKLKEKNIKSIDS